MAAETRRWMVLLVCVKSYGAIKLRNRNVRPLISLIYVRQLRPLISGAGLAIITPVLGLNHAVAQKSEPGHTPPRKRDGRALKNVYNT
jgi:hypothetical protein